MFNRNGRAHSMALRVGAVTGASFAAILGFAAGAGNDVVAIDETDGAFADDAITLDGGSGNDTLTGGSGSVVLDVNTLAGDDMVSVASGVAGAIQPVIDLGSGQ